MTHSVGYYTGYTPGDSGLLAEMQETYGAQLQGLNNAERLCLISMIASDLCCLASAETPYRSDMFNLMYAIKDQLPTSDQQGLIQCLINGVRFKP